MGNDIHEIKFALQLVYKHKHNYHTSYSWECMRVSGNPCSCVQFIKSRIFYYKSRKNSYQYYKSRENPYQVLQVTGAASEHAMKLKVHMINVTIVPSYTGKNITRLLPLALFAHS